MAVRVGLDLGLFVTEWDGHRLGLNFGHGFSDPKSAKCTDGGRGLLGRGDLEVGGGARDL